MRKEINLEEMSIKRVYMTVTINGEKFDTSKCLERLPEEFRERIERCNFPNDHEFSLFAMFCCCYISAIQNKNLTKMMIEYENIINTLNLYEM